MRTVCVETIWFMDFLWNRVLIESTIFKIKKKTGRTGFLCIFRGVSAKQPYLLSSTACWLNWSTIETPTLAIMLIDLSPCKELNEFQHNFIWPVIHFTVYLLINFNISEKSYPSQKVMTWTYIDIYTTM